MFEVVYCQKRRNDKEIDNVHISVVFVRYQNNRKSLSQFNEASQYYIVSMRNQPLSLLGVLRPTFQNVNIC